jgi:hypothetical protein
MILRHLHRVESFVARHCHHFNHDFQALRHNWGLFVIERAKDSAIRSGDFAAIQILALHPAA